MLIKQFISIVILCLFGITIYAQENTDTTHYLKDRKPGVYKTYQDFLNNNPVISKPLRVVHVKAKYKPANQRLTYQFLDSSAIDKNAWGIFDGDKVYYNSGSDIYIPLIFAGRYSFYIYKDYSRLTATSPVYIAVRSGGLDSSFSMFDYSIMFYNEKGKLKKANNQSIGWLIRNDKDFVQEYDKETVLNNNVFKKYLLKMNQRYPLN